MRLHPSRQPQRISAWLAMPTPSRARGAIRLKPRWAPWRQCCLAELPHHLVPPQPPKLPSMCLARWRGGWGPSRWLPPSRLPTATVSPMAVVDRRPPTIAAERASEHAMEAVANPEQKLPGV
ncbi:Os06g0525300 [Oryza sativa Japonica Group]|uniref:Os06g0525300 protein n=1 Tax=Oryza sativa subsp. japonica TaxID=39947 RepID=A0A0N7KM75_ORYSJ|nr:Os06g0525300 [Oryza sativa Japonica Group]